MHLIAGLLITLAVLGGVVLMVTIFAVVVPAAIMIALAAVFIVVPIAVLLRVLRWGFRS